jgi:2-dehydropantoate 2-reductase
MNPCIGGRAMKRILVLGCGGIGGVVTARLFHRGHSVIAVDIDGELVDAINSQGIHIEGYNCDMDIDVRVYKEIPPGEKYDIILLAVKSYDTQQALRDLKPHLAEEGLVVSLQNGINEDYIKTVIPKRDVVGCVIAWAVINHGGGRLTITSPTLEFYIGYLDGTKDERLFAVRDLLNDVFATYISDNIYGHLWSKLLINCFVNPACAIFDKPIGVLLSDRNFLPTSFKLISEVIVVAEREEIVIEKLKEKIDFRLLADRIYIRELEEDKILSPLRRLLLRVMYLPNLIFRKLVFIIMVKQHRDVKSSMWQDIYRGKPTEIDYINGYVVETGKKHGIHCRENEVIMALMKELEERGKLDYDYVIERIS